MRYLGNAVGHQQATSPTHTAPCTASDSFEEALHNNSATEIDREEPLADATGEGPDTHGNDSESSSDEEDPECAYIPSGDEDDDVPWTSEDEDEVLGADLGPEDGEGDDELDDFVSLHSPNQNGAHPSSSASMRSEGSGRNGSVAA